MHSGSKSSETGGGGRHSSKEKKSSASSSSSAAAAAAETKQPLRTFGEWSEFMSSTGKIYYYNSKTEKAQWDKPDEWDYLVMEDRSKMDRSAGYYPPPPSSKDYKRSYRGGGGGKYESDAYDYGSPNMNMSSKQHRLSSDYKGYSRESYSNDYMMSQTGYRGTSSYYSEHHRPPSYHMPDYYETGPPSNSSANNDYYNGGGGGGGYARGGYGTSKEQDKYWSEQQSRGSKSRVASSSLYSKSGRDDKDDLRYQSSAGAYGNGMYDESGASGGGGKGYMYHKHTSRFDSYNENSNPASTGGGGKYQTSSSVDALPSSARGANYAGESDYARYKGSSGRGGADYYDYYEAPAVSASNAPTRPYSRGSSSSSNSSNTNNSYSKSHKKMKRYDENRPDYGGGSAARNRSSSPGPSQPHGNSSKSVYADAAKSRADERESSNEVEMAPSSTADAPPANSKAVEPSTTTTTSSTTFGSYEERSAALVRAGDAAEAQRRAGSSEPTTSTKSGAVSTTDEAKEAPLPPPQPTKETLLPRVTIAMPLLGTSVEDINKYYKPELATRFLADLGTTENINWINQPYTKLLAFSKSAVELKNYRSLVRINEIKKTLLEQRLLFLQTQMKEIEEYLS